MNTSKVVKQMPFDLSQTIADSENIARFIFSPINVNPTSNKLKPNCLKPPTGLDEVSVNRFDYTDENFLKSTGLQMQNPKKLFYGLAIMRAKNIRDNNFDIVYSPIKYSNIYHSDIKIGYFVEKDVELPAEISAKIRNILNETKLFVDKDTSQSIWVGDEIKL
ncbi:MAG TPA: hypothetical protein PKD51_06590 [Saprospiraceae bacterium]|nr:hypothetical protein [Saprospiraceae bacterium]HMU04533.1 hypothetical protein [Saprospiraceae bacterium]